MWQHRTIDELIEFTGGRRLTVYTWVENFKKSGVICVVKKQGKIEILGLCIKPFQPPLMPAAV